jgi:hypothetical protein
MIEPGKKDVWSHFRLVCIKCHRPSFPALPRALARQQHELPQSVTLVVWAVHFGPADYSVRTYAVFIEDKKISIESRCSGLFGKKQ